MAKYSVTFSCGHSEERQLFGKETERQRFIAWAADHGVCSACKAADKAAGIEAVEIEHGLPALIGSERQVNWARQIRAEKIKGVAEFVAAAEARTPADKRHLFEAHAAAVMQGLFGKDQSRFWIDNKDRDARTLAEAAYKESAR